LAVEVRKKRLRLRYLLARLGALLPVLKRACVVAGRVLDRVAPFVFLLVISAGLAKVRPHFLSSDNLLTMVRQYAVIIVLAIGQTMLMISGAIDLSVGSVLALSTVTAALLHGAGANAAVVGIGALATACGAELVNGLVTTKAGVPPFIATLGMMGMARGLALILSGAITRPIPAVYGRIGVHTWFFASCVVAVAAAAYIVLARTAFGRHTYALGGNREAARLSGVNVDRHTIKVFVINGLVVGIASILLLARLGVASPTSGELYELDSIAAAVIGGTSLFGGQGTIGGSIIGSTIMAVLRNGCHLLGVEDHWQKFAIGAMTILAVFYDGLRRRRRRL